jgi:hypothetical protein
LEQQTKCGRINLASYNFQLQKVEECDEDGVPYATALYGAKSLEEFKQIYASLESIKCPGKPTTTEDEDAGIIVNPNY